MWNSCENWSINKPALPTSSGLKPSCCSKCECNDILVWLFSYVLIFSKLSTRNSVQRARPLSRLTQGNRAQFFWEEGAPKLSPRAHCRWLWECSSELYVSSIERLDMNFSNFVLKILAKFVICFLLFSFSS